MTNKYLAKLAALSPETKKELAQTGVIGAVGSVTSVLTNKIVHPNAPKGSGWKAGLIGGGLGLAGDYAAVKLNRHLEKKIK